MDTQRQGHLHWPIRTGEVFEIQVLPSTFRKDELDFPRNEEGGCGKRKQYGERIEEWECIPCFL